MHFFLVYSSFFKAAIYLNASKCMPTRVIQGARRHGGREIGEEGADGAGGFGRRCDERVHLRIREVLAVEWAGRIAHLLQLLRQELHGTNDRKEAPCFWIDAVFPFRFSVCRSWRRLPHPRVSEAYGRWGPVLAVSKEW